MITLVVTVEDRPGVLTRVTSLVRRRAFNIESLTVGHTESPGTSRITLVVESDADGARRLEHNLYKLVDVLHIEDVTERPSVQRDLALIKVRAGAATRPGVMQIIEVYRARVVDVSPESLIVEATGTVDKIDSLVEVLRPYGIADMARTGRLAMARGGEAAAPRALGRRPRAAAAADEGIACSV